MCWAPLLPDDPSLGVCPRSEWAGKITRPMWTCLQRFLTQTIRAVMPALPYWPHEMIDHGH